VQGRMGLLLVARVLLQGRMRLLRSAEASLAMTMGCGSGGGEEASAFLCMVAWGLLLVARVPLQSRMRLLRFARNDDGVLLSIFAMRPVPSTSSRGGPKGRRSDPVLHCSGGT